MYAIKQVWLASWLFLLLPSCSVLDHAPEIEEIGKTAIDVGTSTSMFNPTIGIWIVTVGGLVVAVSKILSLFNNKENK